VKEIKENIWDFEHSIILQNCNTYCVMGAGIAAQIKSRYPEAYQADLATKQLGDDKLGNYSIANIKDKNLVVVNIYGQIGIGNDGGPLNRNAQYDYIFDALYRFADDITKENPTKKIIVSTVKICAGLAGGSWRIVEAILLTIEEAFPNIEFHVYTP